MDTVASVDSISTTEIKPKDTVASIDSISTTEIKPKDKEDIKCAPGRKYEHGSCFKTHELIKMAHAYNVSSKNKINFNKIKLNKINLKNKNKKNDNSKSLNIEKYIEDFCINKNTENINNSNDEDKKIIKGVCENDEGYKEKYSKYEIKIKKFLLKELNEKLGNVCKSQKCWTEQNFMNNIDEDDRNFIKNKILRPSGPTNGTKWLNTVNIDEVLEQYEVKYNDFKYLGTMPQDFQNHSFLKQNKDFYKNLYKLGKTKIAMVYNTDNLGESGQHWNAMFANLENGEIYFFDSYGVKPGEETENHMNLIKEVIQDLCGNVGTSNYNRVNFHDVKDNNKLKCNSVNIKNNEIRHQYKGSECGVYSINFILRMLRGDKFDDICNNKIPDDRINKCRKIYFRKE